MSSYFIGTWKQLEQTRKEINEKARSTGNRVMIGKIPKHFMQRLHERIAIESHDKVAASMFNYIQHNTQRLLDIGHGKDLRITNGLCSIVLEVRHGVRTPLDPDGLNVIVTPKTVFSSQSGWNKFKR